MCHVWSHAYFARFFYDNIELLDTQFDSTALSFPTLLVSSYTVCKL